MQLMMTPQEYLEEAARVRRVADTWRGTEYHGVLLKIAGYYDHLAQVAVDLGQARLNYMHVKHPRWPPLRSGKNSYSKARDTKR